MTSLPSLALLDVMTKREGRKKWLFLRGGYISTLGLGVLVSRLVDVTRLSSHDLISFLRLWQLPRGYAEPFLEPVAHLANSTMLIQLRDGGADLMEKPS